MFILTAEQSDDDHLYTLVHAGRTRYVSTDAIALARRMLKLGINDPLPLIAASRQWGTVEIKEPN